MSKTLVIAARELRDRKRMFVVAAAFAVLPFLAAMLPAARSDRGSTIAVLSGVAAAAVGLGIALTLGVSTIGGELAARRLSFYFSKPVSAASIWFGKVAAALITAFGALLIITIPSYLAAKDAWELIWVGTGRGIPWMVAIGVIVLFFMSHAIGTMVRSRSPWFALDFALAAIAAGLLVLILRPIVIGGAFEVALIIAVALGIALILILAIAPVWQLTNGRTDARRNHTALSKALWLSLGAVLAIAAAYAIWLTTPSVQDLTRIADLDQSPASDRILLIGNSEGRRDYNASFIIDTTTGHADRLPAPPWWGAPQFSRDGRVMAWVFATGLDWRGRDLELYTRRLDRPGAKDVATGIRIASMIQFALSPDGERVAVATRNLVSVYDIGTRKLVAAAGGFDEAARQSMYFLSPDLLRIVEYGHEQSDVAAPLRIFELDVAKRSIAKTGEAKAAGMTRGSLSASADGSRMLIRKARLVVDGRTGATIHTLPIDGRAVSSAMLHDGRVALVQPDGQRARVRVLGLSGEVMSDVVLPTRSAFFAGEVGDGKVILLGFDGQVKWGPGGEGRTMFVVDPAKNAVVQSVPNVKGPIPRWWGTDPREAQFREGQLLAGVDAKNKVVLWDPRTGSVKPLL